MKISKNIKRRIGTYVLRTKFKHVRRDKRLTCFEDSKSVGLIFNATEQANYDIVYEFVSYLRTLELNISAIGYINEKNVPTNYLLRKHFNYFLESELNWYKKPTPPFIDNFINTNFDILINLDIKKSYPLQYIAGLCKARFKVGKHTEKDNFCDLTIEMGENNNIGYLLEQIKHYLPQLAHRTLSSEE